MKVTSLLQPSLSLMQPPRAPLARTECLLLLGHMGGHTSALRQLLEAHPAIVGQAERSRGGYGGTRQISRRHEGLRGHRRGGRAYVLDTQLHHHGALSEEVRGRADVRLLVMLRRPESTLDSILQRARQRGEETGPGDPAWVGRYYCSRLARIREEVERAPGTVGYLDAEDLLERPEEVLPGLQQWLGLESPLGDSSAETRLVPGRWRSPAGKAAGTPRQVSTPGSVRYGATEFSADILAEAEAAYEACREELLIRCVPIGGASPINAMTWALLGPVHR